jgi:hypothetical protein
LTWASVALVGSAADAGSPAATSISAAKNETRRHSMAFSHQEYWRKQSGDGSCMVTAQPGV